MILYLHGFNSSPQSTKAQYLKAYLEERGKGSEFLCPQLPHEPERAIAVALAEVARYPASEIALVGSSLGGFYATWLAENQSLRAVLINPAIEPHRSLRPHLGSQQSFYGRETYELTENHLAQWERLFVPRVHPEKYLLLVETGDDVLDYRAAVRKYRGAEQVIVQGGDHTLSSFPEHVPLILAFAGMG
jgi:predicted esterase YcpF (UPF0227 family)